MRTQKWLAAAGLLIGGALAIAPAQAQYTFTNLADSTTLSGVTRFDDARINASGQVVFVGNSGTATEAYWRSDSGTTTRVLGRGDAAPTGSTYSFLDGTTYSLSDAGAITFRSNLATSGPITTATNVGIFQAQQNGTVTTLVQKGVTVLPGGVGTAASFGNYDANNSGQLVFNTATPVWGTYNLSGGSVTNMVAPGNTAPGTQSGVFDRFAFPDVDDAGNVTFFGRITQDPFAQGGIFNRSAAGVVTKVAVGGEFAPGLTNSRFTFFSRGARNVSGDVAFFGGATETLEQRGIWAMNNGDPLSLVAIQGMAAPGGGIFGNTYELGNLNAAGTGVFRAAGMTGGVTEAIYAFTGVNLTEILSTGDELFGSFVTGVGAPVINDSGLIAFNYTLANGRVGVLRAGIGGVANEAPEPGTLALLGLGLLGGVGVRRMRRR